MTQTRDEILQQLAQLYPNLEVRGEGEGEDVVVLDPTNPNTIGDINIVLNADNEHTVGINTENAFCIVFWSRVKHAYDALFFYHHEQTVFYIKLKEDDDVDTTTQP